MSKNFNTTNETFRKIMGNGLTHMALSQINSQNPSKSR